MARGGQEELRLQFLFDNSGREFGAPISEVDESLDVFLFLGHRLGQVDDQQMAWLNRPKAC